MGTISYDGSSLLVDGKREWLVSATVHYLRAPSSQWPRLLQAVHRAGCNCVVAPCAWNAHEVSKGRFEFTGDRDVRSFLQIAWSLGLRAILRVGPVVGGVYDMGGMPAWAGVAARRIALPQPGEPALKGPPVAGVRSGAPEFLDHVSKWLAALSEQFRDLQATSSPGGPVILVQVEHEWFCSHDAVAQGYLGEVTRFLREEGVTVPTINCNNLHAGAEGDIDGWSTPDAPLRTFRQLRGVRTSQPAALLEFAPGEAPAVGHAHDASHALAAVELQRRFVEALAAGAQPNLSRFFEGQHPGFLAGRPETARDRYPAASAGGLSALVPETLRPGHAHRLVRRAATFASRFGRVFANLDPTWSAATLAPGDHQRRHGVSVVHVRGSRGGVVFLLGDGTGAAGAPAPADLLLPNGQPLTVHFGEQRAAWALLEAQVAPRATLDYCSLCAFALVGRVLVVFGPAGAQGSLSINSAHLDLTVPAGKSPLIEEHEGVVVVVCSEEQIDATCVSPGPEEAVFVGVAGFTERGEPIPHPEFRTRHRIGADGAVTHKSSQPAEAKSPRAPSLGAWSAARCSALVDGSSEQYRGTAGPATLEALGAPLGYGWMRVRLTGPGGKVRAGFFHASDRAHVFCDGEAAGLVGAGPGADDEDVLSVTLSKKPHTLTLLLDNLGRASGGSNMGEPKGLYGPIWLTSPLKAGRWALETGAPLRPLAFRTPLMHLGEPDQTDSRRLTWTLQHRRKTPIVMTIGAWAAPGLVVLNDDPIHFLDPSERARVTLPVERLRAGKNTVQIALVTDPAAGGRPLEAAAHVVGPSVSFHECEEDLTAKAEWAFAPWGPPSAGSFEALRGDAPAKRLGAPAWWRATFKPGSLDTPLFLDAAGLTKGQVFVNGRNVCRYWVATPDGKALGPQRRFLLPDGWLRAGEANELLVFDEHGASPGKCRLVYDEAGPLGA